MNLTKKGFNSNCSCPGHGDMEQMEGGETWPKLEGGRSKEGRTKGGRILIGRAEEGRTEGAMRRTLSFLS